MSKKFSEKKRVTKNINYYNYEYECKKKQKFFF